MATIDEFANITRKVISSEGFDEYLPTVLYPNRKSLAALDGVPESEDVEPIAVAWATKGAVGNEEFLVAFKISDTQFKIVRRSAGHFESGTFDVVNNA